jgi:DNA-binding FrmR family transcriptional regulator
MKERDMEKAKTAHLEEIPRLRKIEGQVRGIQRMIQDERYCVDIINQLQSAEAAIKRVEENILERHIKGCVQESFLQGTGEDRVAKIREIVAVLKKVRK